MKERDIVVIGASAGGIEALSEVVANLPPEFPGSVFVVIHVPADATSALPKILSRRGNLPAKHPRDGEAFQRGQIYVAPPNCHMMLEAKRIRLVRGQREHGVRPAVDPLFRSAGISLGSRVTAVVLSGNLDDGTSGLEIVKANGGMSLVQNPDDALYSGMIKSAIESGCVDEVVPLVRIAARLAELANEAAEAEEAPMAEDEDKIEVAAKEAAIDELDFAQLHSDEQPGVVSAFVCPECSGTLWEITGSEILRFRCRVGHAYAIDSLLASQQDAIENAFWVALRALEERGALMRRLVRRAEDSGHKAGIQRYNEEAKAIAKRAKTLRDIILSGILTNGADTRSS